MVFDEDPPHQKSSNPLEKWSQQATTSAFGIMESLKGQGSSFAKNLKSFGKSLIKEGHSASGATTPPGHKDDDIRLTWLTNRLVLADTLHVSKEGLLKAEKAVVREMIDCQPYVVVNVLQEPLKLDGYAKSVHIPLGFAAKGGLAKQPTIRSMIPILNEYCLLTNDAAIVIFGSDENTITAAAFCLVASRSLSQITDFLRDSLRTRFEKMPTTHKLFIEQCKDVVKMHARNETPSIGILINTIYLEPGNVEIDGEIYVAIQQGNDNIKVFEIVTARNSRGQIVVPTESLEALDDVVVVVGQKGNVRQPILTARFNTQLLESDDSAIVLTPTEMDVSRLVAQPVQDLRMIVNFATRRTPTLNSFSFDRYKLLCVRNEKELDGYQKSYGCVDSEDESPILRSGRRRQETAPPTKNQSSSSFFDTLQFTDNHEKERGPEKSDMLLDDDEKTADLLGGFSLNDGAPKTSKNFMLGDETPILSAPTPSGSEVERKPSPSPAIDDLLGIGATGPQITHQDTSNSSSTANLVDFDFGAPIHPTGSATNLNKSTPPTSSWSNTDLLGGFTPLKATTTTTPPNTRVSSANNSKPVSAVNSQSDFEAFLSNYPEKNQPPVSTQTQQTRPQAPTKSAPKQNTYKPAFGDFAPMGGAKVSSDAFSDLLGQGGFKSTKESQKQSIGTMLKAEQAKNLTPEEVAIRDWTQGKEKNIRALLGSLNDVLWDGADKWNQPTMGDLLTADQIKKSYRKACLVVHPDKLTGSPHLELAKMIFTELNDAYSKYQNDPTIS